MSTTIFVRVDDYVKEQFTEACGRKNIGMSTVLREAIVRFIIESRTATDRICTVCSRPILHNNEEFPYCSHRCAGITSATSGGLSARDWYTGAPTITRDGRLGSIATFKDAVTRRCSVCGELKTTTGVTRLHSGGFACGNCIILVDAHYTMTEEEPIDENVTGGELLARIKKIGG